MKNQLNYLKSDLPAGVVVFLVAVPLCLGIAAVSGVPPFAGLIAGFIGGIVVGLISGSKLGVSGPAAGLAVIVYDSIDEIKQTIASDASGEALFSEAFSMFLLAVFLAGVFQVILGFLKGGIIGYYFPSSVIKGMLSGIGLTIFLKELPHVFGYDKNGQGDYSFFHIDGENTFVHILNAFGNPDLGATIIALVGLAILILWEQNFIRKHYVFNIIQGPLVAILAGVTLVVSFEGGAFEMLAKHLVNVPVASSSSEFISFFSLPDFGAISSPLIWKTAVVIAIVASLETLLCVEATDKLDPEKNVTPPNRELKAQGVGNMISGLLGGLPITQVIVRSSANIQSGGKSKLSAVFHGFLILGFVGFLPQLLNLIPRASLAAILLMVGYKLAKPATFRSMWQGGMGQFLPFMITILLIIFKDLLWGVSIGLVVAIFEVLYLNYKKPYNMEIDDTKKTAEYRIQLSEDVSFLNKARILDTLDNIPDGSKVIIDARPSAFIHPDVMEIIEDFKTHASFSDIEVEFLDSKN